MADKPDSSQGRTPSHDIGKEMLRETFVVHGLPFLLKLAQGEVQRKVEDAHKKVGDKTTFADAMTKLAAKVPEGQHAHDVITDFMTDVTDPYCLTSNVDREDFQVNAARTGPKVEDTVAFLERLAKLPDHKSRKEFLDACGFIGARSVDNVEWAQAQLKALRDKVPGIDGVMDAAKQGELAARAQVQRLDAFLAQPSVASTTNQLAKGATSALKRAKRKFGK